LLPHLGSIVLRYGIFPNPKLSARDRVTHDHHHNVDLLTRMDLANKGISRIDSERG
jgi:hypothetical protein